MFDKTAGRKVINIVELLIKENNSYTFDDRKISDIFKKLTLIKKQKTLIKKKLQVDKLFAEKPKNCMEQVTLKDVKSAIKDLNSYSALGPDRIGTLLIKNGSHYLHRTITKILNATFQLKYFPVKWKRDNSIYSKKPWQTQLSSSKII